MARAKLTDISGLGDRFAGRLRAAGFGSIAKLAAASPEDVAQVKGVALERAATFIAAAIALGGDTPATPAKEIAALEAELRDKIAAKADIGGKAKPSKKQKKKKRKKDRKKKRGKKDKKDKGKKRKKNKK